MASFSTSETETVEEVPESLLNTPPAPPEVKAKMKKITAAPTATMNAPTGIDRAPIRLRNLFSLVLLRRRSDRDSVVEVTIFGSAIGGIASFAVVRGDGVEVEVDVIIGVLSAAGDDFTERED